MNKNALAKTAEVPEKKTTYSQMAVVAVDRVKKEYDCASTTEKMLAEQIGIMQINLFALTDALATWLNAAGRRNSPIKGREIDALSRHIGKG